MEEKFGPTMTLARASILKTPEIKLEKCDR